MDSSLKQISEINYDVLEEIEKSKWKRIFKTMYKDWQLYVLLLPLIASVFLFSYLPMEGILRAFQKTSYGPNGTFQEWTGVVSFQSLISGTNAADFWRALKNTFVLSLYGLIFGFPIPIILAILFSEIRSNKYRSIVQVASYLPKFISTVVITTMLIYMVRPNNQYGQAGIIAMFLERMGLIKAATEVNLLSESQYFRSIYHMSGIWSSAGYGSIVYFAAIMGISPTNYEAAKIDGANKLEQIRYVTLPGIMPTLTIMLILKIGDILSVGYEKILLLYNDGTMETADVLSTFVYRLRNEFPSIGIAADFFNAVIGMFLVLGANYISRKVSETSLF
ncbi:carbohydrate ABC transporter, permease protein [Alteracholeplasma palmae J233]|uniref:Carbohydrate ABC transporter, permease protein n=1 Tax=Alteracholeplasma palmae (strain ATCC 49389 / J233) TaxID=1318466 RepID=U4KKQ1_ALTPJ|nr:ABC transporter permease subunit [Alteracholeplasma palmae]CCV64213.1 carbohydrate ABC transporter, permease protein [Alteracholeplasma palmae J233]